jgi:endogenous inhibitor of DNA gyrase (YacG/DUF329 family)
MFTWNCEPFAALLPSTDLCHLVDDADGTKHCIVCNAPALSVCKLCAVTPYCSKACQAVDWGIVHKQACRVLRVMMHASGGGGGGGGASAAGADGPVPVPPTRLPEGMSARDFSFLGPLHVCPTPPEFAVEGVPDVHVRLDTVLAADDAARAALGAHLATAGHRKVRLQAILEGTARQSTSASLSTIASLVSATTVTEVATGLWRGKYTAPGKGPVPLVAPLCTWVWILGAGIALHPIVHRCQNPVLTTALMQMQDEVAPLGLDLVGFTVKVTVDGKQAVAASCPLIAVQM